MSGEETARTERWFLRLAVHGSGPDHQPGGLRPGFAVLLRRRQDADPLPERDKASDPRDPDRYSRGPVRPGAFHNAQGRKNSAPNASTVADTSARSRNSLRCSQDVSAISRQPWQAAPFNGW